MKNRCHKRATQAQYRAQNTTLHRAKLLNAFKDVIPGLARTAEAMTLMSEHPMSLSTAFRQVLERKKQHSTKS